MNDDEYEEFMNREDCEVYMAIMDNLGVNLVFIAPDESPIWEAARLHRELS